jgi:hypothetical protein
MTTLLAIFCLIVIFLAYGIGLINLNFLRPTLTSLLGWMLILASIALIIWDISPAFYKSTGPNYRSDIFYPLYPEYIATAQFIAVLGVSLGLFAIMIPKGGNAINKSWYAAPVDISSVDKILIRYFPAFLALGCSTAVLYVFYIGGVSKLPIYLMLTGSDYLEIINAREDAFKFFPWYAAHPFHFLRSFFFPVLLIFSYVVFRKNPSISGFCRFAVCFFVALIFNTSSSALSPGMWLIVYIGFSEIILRPSIKIRTVLIAITFGLLLFPIHYFLVSLTSNEWGNPVHDAMGLLKEQILFRGYTAVENGAVFTNVFPPDSSKVGIGGIPKLAALLGFDIVPINNILYNYIVPNAAVTSGTYNGVWFHYDLVMFGYWWVLIMSIALGVLLATMDIAYKKGTKDCVTISIYSFTVVAVLGLFDRPVWTWLITHAGVIGIIVLFILRTLFAPSPNRRNISHKTRNQKNIQGGSK